eukprot:Rmarinus@m.14191
MTNCNGGACEGFFWRGFTRVCSISIGHAASLQNPRPRGCPKSLRPLRHRSESCNKRSQLTAGKAVQARTRSFSLMSLRKGIVVLAAFLILGAPLSTHSHVMEMRTLGLCRRRRRSLHYLAPAA